MQLHQQLAKKSFEIPSLVNVLNYEHVVTSYLEVHKVEIRQTKSDHEDSTQFPQGERRFKISVDVPKAAPNRT